MQIVSQVTKFLIHFEEMKLEITDGVLLVCFMKMTQRSGQQIRTIAKEKTYVDEYTLICKQLKQFMYLKLFHYSVLELNL